MVHRLRYVGPLVAAVVLVIGSLFLFVPRAHAVGGATIRPAYNAAQPCISESGTANWSQVHWQQPCQSDDTDVWYSTQGGGWHGLDQIVNSFSGKCLQDGNDDGPGTVLTVYTCNGSESQAWTPDGGYWIHGTGLAMDSGNSTGPQVWTYNGSHAQVWHWVAP